MSNIGKARSSITSRGGGSSYIPRTDFAQTTASLANNAVETSSMPFAKTFLVLKVVVSAYARVRLYSTAAAAAADVARPFTTPPVAGTQHEVIMDMQLDATYGSTSFVMSPAAVGANMDAVGSPPVPQSTIYYNITNLSGITGTITATITVVPVET